MITSQMYLTSAKNDQIHRFAEALGADEAMLRDFMQLRVTEANINDVWSI